MDDLIDIIKKLGLTTKAARIYLAALELGEASVQQLAQKSKLKRTTLYYILDELIDAGILIPTRTGKKLYYVAEKPSTLLKNTKENIAHFEHSLSLLEERGAYMSNRPRTYFLYGTAGFKQVWDMILDSPEKMYRIITEGENFLDYVREKYILDEIISKKKQLGVSSRQLIRNSAYAKQIVAKDARENRTSRMLPAIYKLPFTEIITDHFVACISSRHANMIFVVENAAFAKMRQSIFEMLWDSVR
ncbi:MAG: hypothetical protein KGI50_04040 [Patescibacteria group bacterium]|nr:hypothetical protein [Patescibacteria group bacterium]MDE2438858.1 hypothetical protein [Patescibacteria group bacterium]